jgi:hypothetical protein
MTLFSAYQDVLFRLSMDPRAKTHRGVKHARPLRAQTPGGDDGVLDTPNGVRGDALNTEKVQGAGSDHVEFRSYDGSLDEGEIQTRLKISLGLVYAALRMAGDPDWKPPAHQEVGAHAGVAQQTLRAADGPGSVTVFEPEEAEVTALFREMLDLIFWRPEDREQAMALYSVTSWYGGAGAARTDAATSGLLETAGVPGLEALEPLGGVLVSQLPRGAVFSRSAEEGADRGEAAAASAARLRAMYEGGDAFVSMIAFNRPPYVPNVFGSGGSRRLGVAEFIAMLPRLGWSPGQPLVIAHPTDDISASLVTWASEVAAALGQPVYLPVNAYEYAEDVELPTDRLAGIAGLEVYGPDGGAVDDDGETVTLPGTSWIRLLPGTVGGVGPYTPWPVGNEYVRYPLL